MSLPGGCHDGVYVDCEGESTAWMVSWVSEGMGVGVDERRDVMSVVCVPRRYSSIVPILSFLSHPSSSSYAVPSLSEDHRDASVPAFSASEINVNPGGVDGRGER